MRLREWRKTVRSLTLPSLTHAGPAALLRATTWPTVSDVLGV